MATLQYYDTFHFTLRCVQNIVQTQNITKMADVANTARGNHVILFRYTDLRELAHMRNLSTEKVNNLLLLVSCNVLRPSTNVYK